MQVAVLNSSKLSGADVAFMAEACNLQASEAALAWGLQPINVVSYASAALLPADDVWICEIVDDLDQPGALGYHSDDLAGRPYLRVLAQGAATSVTLSHEVLETLCDPGCDGWRPRGDGTQVALEVCDPVEGDSYGVAATVLGETRTIQVSNYVLPTWFEHDGLPALVDKLGRCSAPFTMTTGGYMVILDAQGNENDVFARYGGLAGMATAGKRLATRNGRLLRRLRHGR